MACFIRHAAVALLAYAGREPPVAQNKYDIEVRAARMMKGAGKLAPQAL